MILLHYNYQVPNLGTATLPPKKNRTHLRPCIDPVLVGRNLYIYEGAYTETAETAHNMYTCP